MLMVRPLLSVDKFAVPPRFFVFASAANPLILVAFTVAPIETISISTSDPDAPPKSVIMSVPESILKVSIPPLPVNLSFPIPPVKSSAPASPTRVSSPASPLRTLSFLPALSVLSPDPPVMVYFASESVISMVTVPEAAVRLTADADVLALVEAVVASNPVIPVTFRLAPLVTLIISPVVRSVIISVPESILKVSLPAPPVS